MRIFIDIGHPAHVHYFRNFIKIMEEKGHSFFITARDKEVVFKLLEYYKIEFKSRGKGKNGIVGKTLNIFTADRIIYRYAKNFKPDLFLSFASPYAAHISFLMRKPHIAFDDTDHAFFSHLMYVPFTKTIVTPLAYLKNYGKKHIRFDGFMEMCSLLPKYFIEDKNLLLGLGFKEDERIIILRFVSWNAAHDVGHNGLSAERRLELVKKLRSYGKIIISSENDLPEELKPFTFKVHPANMHQFLKRASLIVSESLTMAAEAVFLGTPAVCISTAIAGTLNEEVKLGLIDLYRDSNGFEERVIGILKDRGYKEKFAIRVNEAISKMIDPTAFMVWFIESYPQSVRTMKENPKYQYIFK